MDKRETEDQLNYRLCYLINERRRAMRLHNINARIGVVTDRAVNGGGYYQYKTIISDETRPDLLREKKR